VPVPKKPGDRVVGSTVNGRAAFVMRADAFGSDTLLARIVHMVGEAQRTKAPVQRLADKVAEYFVEVVVAIAILTRWPGSSSPGPRLKLCARQRVAVLIIACPARSASLRRSRSPLAMGQGALRRPLPQREAVEKLRDVDTLVVDRRAP